MAISLLPWCEARGVKPKAGLLSMLADWLAILHKKPAGTPLPWQRNEETFVLNGHPERPGSKFKPESTGLLD